MPILNGAQEQTAKVMPQNAAGGLSGSQMWLASMLLQKAGNLLHRPFVACCFLAFFIALEIVQEFQHFQSSRKQGKKKEYDSA